MRGEAWERLVALPSERELDAALAEVRVRGTGVAYHRARVLRGWWALATLAVVVGGVTLGRVSAGVSALPDTGRWSGPNAAEWNEWNAAERAGVATTFALADAELPSVTGPLTRLFIHSWTELEGVRFDEGRAWVEGPLGTGFLMEGGGELGRFSGAIHVRLRGDTMLLSVSAQTRRLFGRTRAGRSLIEEGEGRRDLAVPPGRAMVMRPFGAAKSGEPALVVRIEGPRVPPPGGDVRWRPSPLETGGARSRLFSNRLWGEAEWQVILAGRRGASYGRRGVGGVRVLPLYDPQPIRLRFTFADRTSLEATTREFGDRAPLVVPVLPSRALFGLRRPSSGMYACYFLVSRDPWPLGRLSSGNGCFPESDPHEPIVVRTTTGQTYRAQLLP